MVAGPHQISCFASTTKLQFWFPSACIYERTNTIRIKRKSKRISLTQIMFVLAKLKHSECCFFSVLAGFTHIFRWIAELMEKRLRLFYYMWYVLVLYFALLWLSKPIQFTLYIVCECVCVSSKLYDFKEDYFNKKIYAWYKNGLKNLCFFDDGWRFSF